jgi:hypothetical protein
MDFKSLFSLYIQYNYNHIFFHITIFFSLGTFASSYFLGTRNSEVFTISIWKLMFSIQICDNRHWDYEKNQWCVYEEEEK